MMAVTSLVKYLNKESFKALNKALFKLGPTYVLFFTSTCVKI
jgi:hypothetical protein